jgi:ElaB/YqjD/DUF883 family membrane-anchored ribosome-binding protein
VQALENKVSPNEIAERVMAYGKDNGGELVRNLGAAVRDNPVPALLTAAGLLWMYSGRHAPPTRTPSYRSGGYSAYRAPGVGAGNASSSGTGVYGDDAGAHDREGFRERAAHLRDSASHLRDSASGKLRDTTSRLGDTVHHARDSVQQTTMRARGGFEHMLHDNPMAAGAIAVAVGALLGAALPTTARERELMAPVGGKLADKAREAASAARQKGAEAARELGTPSGNRDSNGDGNDNDVGGGGTAGTTQAGPGPGVSDAATRTPM